VFLKTLEIFGFKSFADKVRIEFTTASRPCSDRTAAARAMSWTMKWSLGNNPRNPFARKHGRRHFCRSETRKPLGVAEVTLLVSNQTSPSP